MAFHTSDRGEEDRRRQKDAREGDRSRKQDDDEET